MTTTMVAAVELGQGVEEAWTDVAAFVPRLLAFLAILVVGWFVARAVAKVLNRVLERVGFDRALERGGIAAALSRSAYDPSDVVAKLTFYALFLVVLQLAFGVFQDNAVSDLISAIIAYLPNVIAAIIIVVIAAAIGSGVRTIVGSTLGALSYGRVLANVAAGSIVAFGIFAALNQLQIAPEIVNGLYYAVLALVVGSGIIAIGGGGIPVTRQYWERALRRIDEEAPKVREEARREAERRQVDVRDTATSQGGDGRADAPARRPDAPHVPGAKDLTGRTPTAGAHAGRAGGRSPEGDR